MDQHGTGLRRATVVVASDAGVPAPRLKDVLAAAGYRVIGSGTADLGPCDLVLIDVRASRTPAADVMRLHDATRFRAPAAGVVVLAGAGLDVEGRRTARAVGDLCLLRRRYEPLVHAVRNRLRLSRLAEEASQRLRTIARQPGAPRLPRLVPDERPARVIVAGAPSPLALAATNVLREGAGCETTCVLSAGQVMRALEAQAFDAALFLPDDENDLLMSLARALRRHRRHRATPVLIAAPDDDLFDVLAARNAGEVIPAAHVTDDLAQRIVLVARRERLARSLRDFLSAPCDPLLLDPHTEAYARAFFADHATRIVMDADRARRPLSLVGVLSKPARETASTDEILRARRLCARAVADVVRAEDMTAALDEEMLVVLLPSTGLEDAREVARRIEGVVSGSVVRATPGIARIGALAVERRAGDRLEETVSQLVAGLNDGGRNVAGL